MASQMLVSVEHGALSWRGPEELGPQGWFGRVGAGRFRGRRHGGHPGRRGRLPDRGYLLDGDCLLDGDWLLGGGWLVILG